MLKISLLGEFTAQVDEERVERWPRKDARQLLKLLALRPGHRLTKEAVIDSLWADAGPSDKLSARLHNALYGLRRTLEPARAERGASRYVLADADTIALATDEGVWIDVDQFEQCVDAGLVDSTATEALKRAVDLYRGPLLPEDIGESWTAIARTHLEQRYLGALRTLAARAEHAGEHAAAIVALQRLLRAVPYDEASHRDLMQLFIALGRPGEAERQYQLCRDALATELGVAPSTETRALLATARASLQTAAVGASEDGAEDAAPRPPAPLFTPPAALPDLIGRDEDVAAVKRLLTAEGTRLVTLCGAGGVGKTQLAIRAAGEAHPAFAQGTAFVSLADLRDADDVPAAIGRALGLKDRSMNGSWSSALSTFLADKQVLLVLDNLEHLLEAASTLSALLASAPRLSILATSRAALNVAGERPYTVSPLALPGTEERPEALARVPAVALFVQRAQIVMPDFRLDERNAADIASLCRRLDGFPLAIELAAARIRLFEPAQLLQRLTQSFDLLSHGRRDSPERHRSLAAVLEWSYQLLPAAAQRLFDWLGLFAGGITLASAEGVCAPFVEEVPDSLDALLEHHLVVTEGAGERRYRMLDTVRVFALDKLRQRGELEAASAAFAHYWGVEAERLDGERTADAVSRAVALFEAEHANFSMALAWATMHESVLAQRLFCGLAPLWMRRGYSDEGYRWIRQLGDGDADSPPELAARMNLRACELMGHIGRFTEAAPYAERSLAASERIGDDRLASDALRILSAVYARTGRLSTAIEYAERSLAYARDLKDHSRMGATLNNLGFFFRHLGRYLEARRCFEEGMAHHRQVGTQSAASTLYNLSLLARLRGSNEEARKLCAESVASARASLDLRQVGCALVDYAELLYLTSASEAGRIEGDRALAEARDIDRRMKDKYLSGCVLQQAGAREVLRGQAPQGRQLLEESLAIHRGARIKDQSDITLLWLARACIDTEAVDDAAEAFGQLLDPAQPVRHYLLASLLDEGARIAARQGRDDTAAQLIASAAAFRERFGLRRTPAEEGLYAALLAQVPTVGLPGEQAPLERLRAAFS